VAELEGAELGYADQSSCVSAVVDWFGPIDFSTMQAQFEGTACNNNTNDASSPESQLIGAPVQEALDKVRAANPITYITAEVPPFLIQHGTADCNIPPAQSQGLYDALSPHLNPDEIFITFIEGAGHGGEQFDAAENVNRVIDFLDTFLK
jgi:dipeptidyl aminopeptidase/acylaminoacyl peptidase